MQKQPDAASLELDCSRESFNKKQQILQSLKCLNDKLNSVCLVSSLTATFCTMAKTNKKPTANVVNLTL